MIEPGSIAAMLRAAAGELSLFALAGIVIMGIGDVLVDFVWIAGALRRRLRGQSAIRTLAPARAIPLAVFVPAWRESAVIGPMLHTMLARWADADIRIYVGIYPNDPETGAVLATIADPRLRVVVNPRPGPTTKADNLNAIWAALLADDPDARFAAIVLHDAEDVVHPGEPAVFAALLPAHDLVQLPVVPLIARDRGAWAHAISATYADEFAEAHSKQLVVRHLIGAAVPSAGVGCALRRSLLAQLAARHGAPFDAGSVTEDYELGLRIGEIGGSSIFARCRVQDGGSLVAVRAHFPDSLASAIRQKARWQAGIALAAWERLGWGKGLAERWMRFQDRRALLSALVLTSGYLSSAGWLALRLVYGTGFTGSQGAPLLVFGLALLAWRGGFRVVETARLHGWREGIGALLRVPLANLIAICAARAAVIRYLREARGAPIMWDKTSHRFPDLPPGP